MSSISLSKFPKNCYGSLDDVNYRLVFVKLIKSENEEWGTNVLVLPIEIYQVWQLEDSYKSEEELSATLDNLSFESKLALHWNPMILFYSCVGSLYS